MVAFKGALFVLGGFDGQRNLTDVFRSADGRTWERITAQAAWPGRWAFGCVVHQGRLFVFGGASGDGTSHQDVWSSSDGVSWDLVSSSAPWSARGMFGAVSFRDRLWLIGGGRYNSAYVYNVEENFNDVWSSADGRTWTLELASAPFSPRRFHSVVVSGRDLLMTSGFELDARIFADRRNGIKWDAADVPDSVRLDRTRVGREYGNLNDVWWTRDGKEWARSVVQDSFPSRHEPSVLAVDARIFVIGGFGRALYGDVYELKRW